MEETTESVEADLRRVVIGRCLDLSCGNPYIIEVGTARNAANWARESDGWSTRWWVERPCELHSIDISPEAVAASKEIVPEGRRDLVTWYVGDAVEVLLELPVDPDILYLDGADDPHAALLQLQACPEPTLILIDDTHRYRGWEWGKGTEVLRLARRLMKPISHFEKGSTRMSLIQWR